MSSLTSKLLCNFTIGAKRSRYCTFNFIVQADRAVATFVSIAAVLGEHAAEVSESISSVLGGQAAPAFASVNQNYCSRIDILHRCIDWIFTR
jgi:hypothetical protein